jgi:hypothetical protein
MQVPPTGTADRRHERRDGAGIGRPRACAIKRPFRTQPGIRAWGRAAGPCRAAPLSIQRDPFH